MKTIATVGILGVLFSGAISLAAQSNWGGSLTATGYAAPAGEPAQWGQLDFNPRFSRGEAWRFTLNAHLTRWSRGPAGRHAFANLDERNDFAPALQFEELSLRRAWSGRWRTEVKAGLLPLRWGRTDGFTPTDTLAPYDYTDLLDFRRPGVAALQGALRGEQGGLELLWLPLFAPNRLPPGFIGAGGRFSAPLEHSGLRAPQGNNSLLHSDDLPARDGRHGEFAARWEWVGSAAEFSFSYKSGYDKNPVLTPLIQFIPPQPPALIALQREFRRVRIYGADLLVPHGAWILRAEAARWQFADSQGNQPDGRWLYTAELEHKAGDWQTIVAYGGVHEDATPAAVIANSANPAGTNLAQGNLPALLVTVERGAVGEWGLKLNGLYALKEKGWLARVSGSWPVTPRWRLEAGGDWLGGPRRSFYGALGGEDRLRLAAVCSF